MIRNRRRAGLAIVAGLALVALVAGALPAQAGGTSWSDPEGDATAAFGEFIPTPLPSDAALDITKSTLSTNGNDLSWVVKIKDLPDSGYPGHSTGFSFSLSFSYANTPFHFLVAEDAAVGKLFVLRRVSDSWEVECGECIGDIDRKTDSVIVTTPIAALADGLAELGLQFGRGSQFKSLRVSSYRLYARTVGRTGDDSDSPNGATYTV